MQYVSSREITEKWGISPILVRRLCRQDRISGAVCKDGVWCIPEDAVRVERTVLEYAEESELPELASQQPNYPDNAESVLKELFDAYNESSSFDNAAIKSDFEELYRLMNSKPLKKIDEIIYAVCTLCGDYAKAGVIGGIKADVSLGKNLFLLLR